MGQSVIESRALKVPLDEGHIIGDTLRKYAMHSVGSWQIVVYKIDSTSPNFGFSNGVKVSSLELMKGYLVSSGNNMGNAVKAPRLCQFDWDGEKFKCGEFFIEGLNTSVGERLIACVNYAKGRKSADENREVIRQVTGGDADGFFCIPSSHSMVSTFKYRVSPVDDVTERLEIEADSGVLSKAIKAAVESLSRLTE